MFLQQQSKTQSKAAQACRKGVRELSLYWIQNEFFSCLLAPQYKFPFLLGLNHFQLSTCYLSRKILKIKYLPAFIDFSVIKGAIEVTHECKCQKVKSVQ